MNSIQLDTTEAATDTISYVATDQKGLTSTSTRTVNIEPAAAGTGDATSSDNSTSSTDATTTI